MPYGWVKPDIALEHKGVKVYYIYRNDDIDDVARTYWFGYSDQCDDSGRDSFDVRDFDCFDPFISPLENVRKAIDLGGLTQDGVQIIDPTKTKRFKVHLVVEYTGNTIVDVPSYYTKDQAIEWAKNHIQELQITDRAEYVPDSEMVDCDGCEFIFDKQEHR